MDIGLKVKGDLIIPMHEIQITTSRAGGSGGQHVNKTNSRITIRWNILNSTVLLPDQKTQLLTKLASKLTTEGDLIVHNSIGRSQQQNKIAALDNLAKLVRKALYIPKKRMKTRVPKGAKEARLQTKSHHSDLKKLRNKKFTD